MAWRFKASKYKNAAPIVPKPEVCIRDIFVGSYQTYGNNIAASAAFMAFNWEHVGSSLAVLPIDDCGRKSKNMPLLHAHTDTVTDLDFSPFHDGLLATGSQDCLVKIWYIPEKGLESSISNAECTFSHKQRRVETVGFHPTADCLLHSTCAGTIYLWDISTQKEAFGNAEHPDVIQSVSWKQDGTLLSTSCKDKMVRIVDPRSANPITLTAGSHQNIKDSRVVWLGDQQRILTTGFDTARLRQIIIRDVRNFSQPEKTLELDCSTGVLMPLFDSDTGMLFLAGKGDTTITYLEVADKDPYLIEGLRHNGEQTKGACLVPKRALRVMDGEVNRILQLTSNSVIPITYQVPRKTYRDFHTDLYPDTNGCKTELSAGQWLNGSDISVPKISLDPSKRELGEAPIVIHRGNLQELIKNEANKLESTRKNATNKYSDKIENQQQRTLSKMELIRKFDNKFKDEMNNVGMDGQLKSESEPIDNIERMSLITDESNNRSDDIVEYRNRRQSTNGDDDNVFPILPPKPLPRSSRNNSITEPVGYGQQISMDDEKSPRPVARPRTNGPISYKPRLGPKPFTSQSGDLSFDKVFSVPHAPGHENGSSDGENNKYFEPVDLSVFDDNNGSIEMEEAVKMSPDNDEVLVEFRRTNSQPAESNGELSKTTAERRKLAEETTDQMFETLSEDKLKLDADGIDGDDSIESDLQRLSTNRCSIADRRRIYESRSKSVVDEKPQSPIPLIRKDSLKGRNDSPKRIDAIKLFPQEMDNHKMMDGVKKPIGGNKNIKSPEKEISTATKRISTCFGKVSKFRHLKGTTAHKSSHIENIRNVSRQIPGECNGFHANHERVAVPIAGPGGKIAVYELSKPGRLPDGVIPTLVNGTNIMDFQWDPFDTRKLAVACDDGTVKLWAIPDDGLNEPINTPDIELVAHSDKIYFIRFHPLAQDVLLTANYDLTIRLWDLKRRTEMISLKGHTDQIFDFAWSPCGAFGATVCKDGKLRIYNARKSEQPIREGNGPVGSRGARISYAIDGHYLLTTGFDKVSQRQISIYKTSDLSAPLNIIELDVSPAILMTFYDEDSSTIFVSGKGDATIYAFEITDESPYICPLSHHRCQTLHQGLSFLAKNQCDVAAVEFARALRLSNNIIEPLSFTVPRRKMELFQDDLFPSTRVTWLPTMTSEDWFNCKDKKPIKVSLKPDNMNCLSSVQVSTTVQSETLSKQSIGIDQPVNHIYSISRNNLISDSDKAMQEEIKKSMSARLEYTTKLEQDNMEGVDEEEWDE